MAHTRTDPGRWVPVLVALLMVAPAPLMFTQDARAQDSNCPADTNDVMPYPIFVTEMVFTEGQQTDPDSVIGPNRTAFVHSGDNIKIKVKLKNRVPSDCDVLYTNGRSDNLRLEVHYLPGKDDTPTTNKADDVNWYARGLNGHQCNDLGGAQDDCQITLDLPRNEDGLREVLATPSGEQRVVVIFEDEDSSNAARAAAERIMVVDQMPDLNPSDIQWSVPASEGDRHTIYAGQEGNTKFDVTIDNEGDYPNWNPNGGNQYATRSPYDGPDADADPENETRSISTFTDAGDDRGASCTYDTDGEDGPDHLDDKNSDGDPLDPGEAPCSYRRGQILDMPILWEATRSGTNAILDSDVENAEIYSTNDIDRNDKPDAILAGQDKTIEIDGLNRNEKAGFFDLTYRIDHRLQDPDSFTPESDETDNEIEETQLEILGVDLAIAKHGINVVTEDGTVQASQCADPNDPCPANATIEVNPRFNNAGDANVDAGTNLPSEVYDRVWNASINVTVGVGDSSSPVGNASAERDGVPADHDDRRLFDNAQSFAVQDNGGVHRVIIRLDHPVSYVGQNPKVTKESGRVAERTERHGLGTCAGGITTDTDNAYCLDLYFEDLSAPTITNLKVDANAEDDEHDYNDGSQTVPTLREGRNATFNATVTDNALVPPVQAVFELPDGNTTTVKMTRVGTSNVYSVTTNFTGLLGDYVYKVKAKDNQHTITSDPGMEIKVAELAKEIARAPGIDTVNGDDNPHGDSAPVYEGTVSDPGNVFNITVEINDTGQDDVPDGKTVLVHHPNGTVMAEAEMAKLIQCERSRAGNPIEDGYNNQCEPDQDPTATIEETNTWWYVDTDHDDWEEIEMPWVGTFNITTQATDVFNRTNSSDWTVKIQDRTNPESGFKRPIVTEVSAGPNELAPGDRFEVSAHAADVLRVERVYLDITKPGGTPHEANLTSSTLDSTETNNGTYTSRFLAGADGKVFDRAGTYKVDLVAEDFGGNENITDLGTVTVPDDQPPTIEEFFTEPGQAQEVGGNITWVAQVDDETTVEPPELTITRPNSQTNTTDMTFDEDRDAWVHTVTTTPSDEGTWSYEVIVADFAGQTASAAGQIDVAPNLAPRATAWTPDTRGDGPLPYGNTTPTVSVQVLDTQGVDVDSINMTMDGETLRANGSGPATVTPIPNVCVQCYKLTYTPPDPLEAGKTVTVELRATDLSEDRKTSEFQLHQFKVDGTPPSVSIDATPSLPRQDAPVIGATSEINVTTSDDGAGPGPAEVTIEHLAGAAVAARDTQILDAGQGSIKLKNLGDVFRGHGTYRIVVEPSDAVGNEGDSVQKRYLFDAAPPKIDLIPQLNKPRSFVSVNVTDISRIQEVVVEFSANDGPTRELELERSDDRWTGRIVNPETGGPYPENTTVSFVVEATDFFGNVATNNETTFQAGNAVPTIAIEEPTSGATLQGTTQVRWTASDAETPALDLNVSLWYKVPGGQPREIPGASDLRNVGQHQLDTTLLPNGDLELQAIVFDGSTFGSDTVNVTVRNLGRTFDSPQIEGAETVDGRNLLAPGQETAFTVQISGNVRAAWANITDADGNTVRSYQLEDAGGGAWRTALTAPDAAGDYSVDLAALTADGPTRTNDAYGFSVQSGEDGKSFVPEWTILSVLFAGAVAVGAFGLSRRWT